MKKRIIEKFGKDVVIAEINGKQDVVTMRSKASRVLQKFFYEPKQEDTEEEKIRLVKIAASMSKIDIKSCETSKDIYPGSECMSSADKALSFLPKSLLQLLDTLFVGIDKQRKSASIGQAIIGSTS